MLRAMDRTTGIAQGGIARPGGAALRTAKANAFKQAMARAMEGAGPPARLPTPAPRLAENAFRARIAFAESSARAPDQGLGARNPTSGALGRYQITPQALRDLGWQDAGGRWTALAARNGVRSEADFLASAPAQEAAMAAYLRRAEQQLDRNGSLARAGSTVTGLDGQAVPLTEAGLVAAAHRRGAGGGERGALLGPSHRHARCAAEPGRPERLRGGGGEAQGLRCPALRPRKPARRLPKQLTKGSDAVRSIPSNSPRQAGTRPGPGCVQAVRSPPPDRAACAAARRATGTR
jgi:hypothetical protein